MFSIPPDVNPIENMFNLMYQQLRNDASDLGNKISEYHSRQNKNMLKEARNSLKMTFEPLMNFKQIHYGIWKYYKSCYI